MLVTVVLVVTTVLTAVWAYSKYRHNYWAARGVPTAPGLLPLLGHTLKLFKPDRWLYVDEVYKNHGGSKLCGFYEQMTPTLMVGDLDLVKAVLIKDFDHFVDRRTIKLTTDRDRIMNNILTNTTGDHWKGIRSALSPTFTSGRMKGMFPLVEKKAQDLVDHLHRKVKTSSAVPLKQTFGLYTLEIISSCAFGMETNSLLEGDSIFNRKVEVFSKISAGRMLKVFMFILLPRLTQMLKVNLSQPELLFFRDVVVETIKKREEGRRGGDFLDLMMDAREEERKDDSKTSKRTLTDDAVVANAILFILAGYDTTANTLSFVAFFLAKHPTEQERVRQELRSLIKEHGGLTYQGLMEAKFLDACISESLRLYPPAHFIERQCTKAYTLPGTDVTIPEKTIVGVPVWSLHHDPRYWSEPEDFRPDRFLPENRDEIYSGTYLPFGLGPRNCIGMRFALMETKLALAKVLLEFELRRTPDSPDQPKLSKQLGVMRPSDDLSLIVTPLAAAEDITEVK